ncbi:hypothetical protein TRIP_C21189 [Candidatus Zixiibacteriota bacterium]|nr:hypothetical protein TRIP_C21189 [candidate division Zixibacteria bacterium]
METEKNKRTIEVSDIFRVAWRRKWLIVIPLILVAAAAYFGSYLITPEYESSIIIYLGNPVRLSDQLRRMVGDVGNVLGDNRYRESELQSLQNEVTSTPYIQRLVDKLHLDQDPSLDKRAEKLRKARPDLSMSQVRFSLILNDLRDRVGISSAGLEQVRISVLSPDPFKARDIAQNLGEILMDEKTKQALGSVRLSQDFTYDQLAKYEKDLQDKIDEKTRFEKQNMGVQLNELVVSDSNRKAISGEIDAINADIQEKKSEETGLLSKLNNVPSSKLVLPDSPDLQRMTNDIQNLLKSVSSLMPRYRWSDPEILNYKTKLYNYINNVEDEIRRLVDVQFAQYDAPTRDLIVQLFSLRTELDILYSKSNILKLALDDINQKINAFPDYQARLEQLNREINAARDLRDRFKEQQEGSQISQALLSEARFQVIEPAKVPMEPVRPNRIKILVMGLILGLMIGAGVALLAELMDNSFKKVEEVEDYLGYPVLGVIPDIATLKKASKSF